MKTKGKNYDKAILTAVKAFMAGKGKRKRNSEPHKRANNNDRSLPGMDKQGAGNGK